MADESHKDPEGRLLALWGSWLIGPVAWGLHLMASYLVLGWVCRSGNHWVLHAITLVTLLMALAGVPVGLRLWTAVGRQWPEPDNGDSAMRIRFMGACGVILSIMSAAIILVEGVPNFMVSPCI